MRTMSRGWSRTEFYRNYYMVSPLIKNFSIAERKTKKRKMRLHVVN